MNMKTNTIIISLIALLSAKMVFATSGSISRSGIEFIKHHESLSLSQYKDAGGRWTIGYGHLIKPGEVFSGGISEPEADSLLRRDVMEASNAVKRSVKVPLSQKQRDALISLAFNIGQGAFSRSTLVKVLNKGNYKEAAIQIRRWNKVDGEPNTGLSRRRMDEMVMFLKGSE